MQTSMPAATLTTVRPGKRFDVESATRYAAVHFAMLINVEYLQFEALRLATVEYPTLPSMSS